MMHPARCPFRNHLPTKGRMYHAKLGRPGPVQRCAAAVRAQATGSATGAGQLPGPLKYQHIMLALVDPSPHFGDGSKQAIAMTGGLASQHQSRVTVLLVDDQALEEDPGIARMDFLSSTLREQGCHDFKVLDQVSPASNDAAIGDVADEVEATLLVLSTEAVHNKKVNSNLLAEFVPCPMLLLP